MCTSAPRSPVPVACALLEARHQVLAAQAVAVVVEHRVVAHQPEQLADERQSQGARRPPVEAGGRADDHQFVGRSPVVPSDPLHAVVEPAHPLVGHVVVDAAVDEREAVVARAIEVEAPGADEADREGAGEARRCLGGHAQAQRARRADAEVVAVDGRAAEVDVVAGVQVGGADDVVELPLGQDVETGRRPVGEQGVGECPRGQAAPQAQEGRDQQQADRHEHDHGDDAVGPVGGADEVEGIAQRLAVAQPWDADRHELGQQQEQGQVGPRAPPAEQRAPARHHQADQAQQDHDADHERHRLDFQFDRQEPHAHEGRRRPDADHGQRHQAREAGEREPAARAPPRDVLQRAVDVAVRGAREVESRGEAGIGERPAGHRRDRGDVPAKLRRAQVEQDADRERGRAVPAARQRDPDLTAHGAKPSHAEGLSVKTANR